jgi:gluconate kinase
MKSEGRVKNPYTTEELIRYLTEIWEKAKGIEYGQEHEIMRCAALRLAKLQEDRQKLDQRIHNQRVALRENWEIIETRASYRRAWYPSKLLRSLLLGRGH